MDTSEEYIKMCKKAKEIQELWDWDKGDVVWFNNDLLTGCLQSERPHEDWRWLPRQDQLQDMVDLHGQPIRFLEIAVDRYQMKVNTLGFKYWAGSMEQLWLGFIMWYKYGKEWNGKKWVKLT